MSLKCHLSQVVMTSSTQTHLITQLTTTTAIEKACRSFTAFNAVPDPGFTAVVNYKQIKLMWWSSGIPRTSFICDVAISIDKLNLCISDQQSSAPLGLPPAGNISGTNTPVTVISLSRPTASQLTDVLNFCWGQLTTLLTGPLYNGSPVQVPNKPVRFVCNFSWDSKRFEKFYSLKSLVICVLQPITEYKVNCARQDVLLVCCTACIIGRYHHIHLRSLTGHRASVTLSKAGQILNRRSLLLWTTWTVSLKLCRS